MKQTTKIVAIVLVVALLIIAVGYAAIGNITLTIKETVTAAASDDNFSVYFKGNPAVTATNADGDSIISNITTNASSIQDGATDIALTVSGLKSIGDKVTVTYTIANDSAENLKANLGATVPKNSNTTYFEVTPSTLASSLNPGAETTYTLTVELIAAPVEDVTTVVDVTITATPESTATAE